jgi:hypothetical protein
MGASKTEPVVKVRIRSNYWVKFSESKTTLLKSEKRLQKQEITSEQENPLKKEEKAVQKKEDAVKKKWKHGYKVKDTVKTNEIS